MGDDISLQEEKELQRLRAESLKRSEEIDKVRIRTKHPTPVFTYHWSRAPLYILCSDMTISHNVSTTNICIYMYLQVEQHVTSETRHLDTLMRQRDAMQTDVDTLHAERESLAKETRDMRAKLHLMTR